MLESYTVDYELVTESSKEFIRVHKRFSCVQIEPGLKLGPSANNAGAPLVNGIYREDVELNDALCFSRIGLIDGRPARFFIFLCENADLTKHWFISVTPLHGRPGTRADINFSTAPLNDTCKRLPPKNGWVTSSYGNYPAPRVIVNCLLLEGHDFVTLKNI